MADAPQRAPSNDPAIAATVSVSPPARDAGRSAAARCSHGSACDADRRRRDRGERGLERADHPAVVRWTTPDRDRAASSMRVPPQPVRAGSTWSSPASTASRQSNASSSDDVITACSMASDHSTHASTLSGCGWVSAATPRPARRRRHDRRGGRVRPARCASALRCPPRRGSAAGRRTRPRLQRCPGRRRRRARPGLVADVDRPALVPAHHRSTDRLGVGRPVGEDGEHGERHLGVVGPLPRLPPEPAAALQLRTAPPDPAVRTRTARPWRHQPPTRAPHRPPDRPSPRSIPSSIGPPPRRTQPVTRCSNEQEEASRSGHQMQTNFRDSAAHPRSRLVFRHQGDAGRDRRGGDEAISRIAVHADEPRRGDGDLRSQWCIRHPPAASTSLVHCMLVRSSSTRPLLTSIATSQNVIGLTSTAVARRIASSAGAERRSSSANHHRRAGCRRRWLQPQATRPHPWRRAVPRRPPRRGRNPLRVRGSSMGTSRATGRPRFVTTNSVRFSKTSSSSERQVDLNSLARISVATPAVNHGHFPWSTVHGETRVDRSAGDRYGGCDDPDVRRGEAEALEEAGRQTAGGEDQGDP